MEKNKKSVIIGISVLVLVTLTLLGLTYAYYRTRIIGNENDKSIDVTSKVLSLEYQDGDSNLGLGEIIEPTDEVEVIKEFKVKNTGSAEVSYSVYLESVINELERTEDLTYVLTCLNEDNTACNGTSVKEYPTSAQELTTNSIAAGTTQTYTLSVDYAYLKDEDQSVDMGKLLEGKLQIAHPTETSEVVLAVANSEEGDYAVLNSNPKISYGEYDVTTKTMTYKFVGVETEVHTLQIFDKENTKKAESEIEVRNGESAGLTTEDGVQVITVSDTDRKITSNVTLSSSGITLSDVTVEPTESLIQGVTVSVLKATTEENQVNGLILYESFNDAYKALNSYWEVNSTGNSFITSLVPKELTWTIYGNVNYDASTMKQPLSAGIRAFYVNKVGDILQTINVVGGNSSAKLITNNNSPWHEDIFYTHQIYTQAISSGGEKVMVNINFKDIEFPDDFSIFKTNNTLMNLNIENCVFRKYSVLGPNGQVTLKNNLFKYDTSKFEGEDLAVYFRDYDEAITNVNFQNNIIDGYPKGVIFEVSGADVVASGNTFKNITHATRAAFQLTNMNSITISNNIFDGITANVFYFHDTYSSNQTVFTNNTISNSAYLAQFGSTEDPLDVQEVTSYGNTVSVTYPGQGISKEGDIYTNNFTLN